MSLVCVPPSGYRHSTVSGLPSIAQCFGVHAHVEVGGVAGGALAPPHTLVGRQVLLLVDADVADLLETQGDRVGGPDVHAVAEDGVEGLRHVEVPHAAAGDAGGAGAHPRLIEDDDLLPRALLPALARQAQ